MKLRGIVTAVEARDRAYGPSGEVVLSVSVIVELNGDNGAVTYTVPGGQEPPVGQPVRVEVTPA